MEHGTGERRLQDLSQATFFHKRADEDNRIDWTWPARDLANLVRAQADPYPNAFCFHGAARLEVRSASVSRTRAGGTPGRIFAREGDGVIIVCGPEARRGQQPRARHRSGCAPTTAEQLAAGTYFARLGGYLTSHPVTTAAAAGRRTIAV